MNVKGKYLNPKADLTFILIFGKHPELVKSLLNALLPLESGREIERVEYVRPEMIPENPGKRYSIVFVRCYDNHGREFIVEMRVYWSDEFKQRVMLNASKAVAKQAYMGENYSFSPPVYSLNLVNKGMNLGKDVSPDEFYHHYAVVNVEHTDRVLEGFHFVFIDLEKFKPKTVAEKKTAVLWLRFLTEIDEETQQVPAELLENEDTRKALQILEKSAYTEGLLQAYSDFWMALVDERVLREDSYKKGREEGRKEGLKKVIEEGRKEVIEKVREEGRAEGRAEERMANARKMKADNMPIGLISKYTGLTADDIAAL